MSLTPGPSEQSDRGVSDILSNIKTNLHRRFYPPLDEKRRAFLKTTGKLAALFGTGIAVDVLISGCMAETEKYSKDTKYGVGWFGGNNKETSTETAFQAANVATVVLEVNKDRNISRQQLGRNLTEDENKAIIRENVDTYAATFKEGAAGDFSKRYLVVITEEREGKQVPVCVDFYNDADEFRDPHDNTPFQEQIEKKYSNKTGYVVAADGLENVPYQLFQEAPVNSVKPYSGSTHWDNWTAFDLAVQAQNN